VKPSVFHVAASELNARQVCIFENSMFKRRIIEFRIREIGSFKGDMMQIKVPKVCSLEVCIS
jgi:hypothetical protein